MSVRNVRKYQYCSLAPGVFVAAAMLVCGKIAVFTLGVCLFFAYYSSTQKSRKNRLVGKGVDPDLLVKGTEIIQRLSAQSGLEAPGCRVCKKHSLANYDSLGDMIELSTKWFDLYDTDLVIAEGVIVHELGHKAQRETRISKTNVFLRFFAVYLSVAGIIETPGVTPRVLFIVAGVSAWFLGRVVSCAGSRRVEADADAFAKWHGYGPSLAEWLSDQEMIKKMDFLRSHPTISQRVLALTS